MQLSDRVRTFGKGAAWLSLSGVLAFAITGCGASTPTGASSTTTAASSTSTAHSAASTSANGSTSTPSRSPTGSFVAQADAICARVNREIIAIPAKSGTAAEVKRVVPRTVSLEQKGLVGLEKLDPPASIATDWRRMLAYRRTLARLLGELLDASKKNDGTSVQPLTESKKRVHASLTKIATVRGFKDCAKIGRVG